MLDGTWRDLDDLMADPAQTGPVKTLPAGVQFGPPTLPLPGAPAPLIGFTRLGATCDPTASCGTPVIDLGTAVVCPNCIYFDGPATVCRPLPSGRT